MPEERRHFILGQPVTVLANFVTENQADVLVMGRVHREGLEKLVGSTTEHALYQLPCSLLAL
ncbi:Universal stress protein family 5 [Pseudomonas chlororaphis subsp. aurantiaca]|nr:Universal stress protein family 5 [Pseudomonas chlororaphis subsp. aurantiaca]